MKLALLTLILAGTVVVRAEIVGKSVDYSAGGVALKGYLAYDNSIKTRRPAVIVIHEWWGLTDYPKKRAEMLAGSGYVAFAADMYGDGKTADNPTDAQKYAGESMKDFSTLKEKFSAAIDLLKKNEFVNPDKISAIGYCYGGGVVLNMARAGLDLKSVVSFHGNLTPALTAQPGTVKTKILVCNGGADKFTSPENVDSFKKEMKIARVDYTVKSYRGALHAFTNPAATELGKKFKMPIAYNLHADKRSWTEMKSFLKKTLK
ncbi:MAG: dienelactone hydrolase family protein [Ignavibacteriae bacterium]|nr:MAG: dienelactone hydrolase family protein [Ignavibacteriota bacterium]